MKERVLRLCLKFFFFPTTKNHILESFTSSLVSARGDQPKRTCFFFRLSYRGGIAYHIGGYCLSYRGVIEDFGMDWEELRISGWSGIRGMLLEASMDCVKKKGGGDVRRSLSGGGRGN